MATLIPPRPTERSIFAVAMALATRKSRCSEFVRSVSAAGPMIRRAYGAGVAYEAAATPSARRRVLREFLADVDQSA